MRPKGKIPFPPAGHGVFQPYPPELQPPLGQLHLSQGTCEPGNVLPEGG